MPETLQHPVIARHLINKELVEHWTTLYRYVTMSPMCKRRKDKISKYERLINIDNIDDNGFEN